MFGFIVLPWRFDSVYRPLRRELLHLHLLRLRAARTTSVIKMPLCCKLFLHLLSRLHMQHCMAGMWVGPALRHRMDPAAESCRICTLRARPFCQGL